MFASGQIIFLSCFAIVFIALCVMRLSGNRQISLALGGVAVLFFTTAYFLFDDALTEPLNEWITDLGQAKKFIGAGFWYSLAYLINAFIKRVIYPRRLTWQGDSKVPLLIQYLVTVLIYLLATMVVVGWVFEQSITGVVAASGAVALALGYSARYMIDEIFAGLAININAPFEKGDLIQLNDEWGYVKDIDWRSITYLDMDNNFVVVPNTKVAASKIRNLDRPDVMTRRTMFIQVEYNVPPRVVIEQCDLAMKECPHIVPHPWNFTSYFDSNEKGMRYKLHFHVKHYDHWYYGSDELLNSIWYRFARLGIRFAHHRHLNFMTKEDEQRGLPGSAYDDANWQMLMARFKQVPMFEGMTPDDMEELARSAKMHIVGPPERIVRAGSEHTSMFLIASGSAEVFEVDEHENETLMATMCETETVGLMSFITGRPQKTTVRAKEECAVWEIGSDSLHALFERKPEVMDAIAANVAQWQAEEDTALNEIAMNRQHENQLIKQRTNRLSKRIARFFHADSPDSEGSDYNNY